MFHNSYQSGSHFEIFDSQINYQKEQTAVATNLFSVSSQANLTKQYDQIIQSFVYELDGHNTKLRFPKDEQQDLSLMQQYLVFQIYVPLGMQWSLEISITDTSKTKRRINLVHGMNKIERKFFHVKAPIDLVRHGVWVNLSIDIWSFMEVWKGQTIRSIDSVIVGSCCKIKRIFTMKNPISDTTGSAEINESRCEQPNNQFKLTSLNDIPQNINFTTGVPYVNQLITFENLKMFCGQSNTNFQSSILFMTENNQDFNHNGSQSNISLLKSNINQTQPTYNNSSQIYMGSPQSSSLNAKSSLGSNQKFQTNKLSDMGSPKEDRSNMIRMNEFSTSSKQQFADEQYKQNSKQIKTAPISKIINNQEKSRKSIKNKINNDYYHGESENENNVSINKLSGYNSGPQINQKGNLNELKLEIFQKSYQDTRQILNQYQQNELMMEQNANQSEISGFGPGNTSTTLNSAFSRAGSRLSKQQISPNSQTQNNNNNNNIQSANINNNNSTTSCNNANSSNNSWTNSSKNSSMFQLTNQAQKENLNPWSNRKNKDQLNFKINEEDNQQEEDEGELENLESQKNTNSNNVTNSYRQGNYKPGGNSILTKNQFNNQSKRDVKSANLIQSKQLLFQPKGLINQRAPGTGTASGDQNFNSNQNASYHQNSNNVGINSSNKQKNDSMQVQSETENANSSKIQPHQKFLPKIHHMKSHHENQNSSNRIEQTKPTDIPEPPKAPTSKESFLRTGQLHSQAQYFELSQQFSTIGDPRMFQIFRDQKTSDRQTDILANLSNKYKQQGPEQEIEQNIEIQSRASVHNDNFDSSNMENNQLINEYGKSNAKQQTGGNRGRDSAGDISQDAKTCKNCRGNSQSPDKNNNSSVYDQSIIVSQQNFQPFAGDQNININQPEQPPVTQFLNAQSPSPNGEPDFDEEREISPNKKTNLDFFIRTAYNQKEIDEQNHNDEHLDNVEPLAQRQSFYEKHLTSFMKSNMRPYTPPFQTTVPMNSNSVLKQNSIHDAKEKDLKTNSKTDNIIPKEEGVLEVVYDADLQCYYDPVTKNYYELNE